MTVSPNPALVEFPRDEWGFTSELRKVGLRSAAAIRGDEAKLTLYIQTLATLAQHAQARIAGDVLEREERRAAAATSGRISTTGISTTE